MPGIVGLITRMPRECAESQLQQMITALRHESFYATGSWIDESLGVYVGWVARKGSFSDGMPLCNEGKDVVLAFAGDDYPEPDARTRLQQRGHGVEDAGPSYLVHLYEDDPNFLPGLNGRFHGLLADRTRGTALLFNDRYGMQRVYVHEAKEALYFAAEAKAILAVRPELRRIDLRGLGEFISCGCVLENRTLFDGIQVLPPASAWVFRGGNIERKGLYFQPRDWEDQSLLDSEAYYRELRQAFTRTLPRYFAGSERVAVSLTGGLDTRMIMAWHKPPPGALPCYTFGGTYRDAEDVTLARRVARVCGQTHQVIRAGEDFLARFPRYAERTVYLTDGCVEVSRAPVLYVNEKARDIAPVRMTGNYGGEVLRRVRLFKPGEPSPGMFQPDMTPHLREARATYDSLIKTHPLSFAVFRQAPWHHYGLMALEQSQLTLRSPYLDNDLVRTVFRAPESACRSNDVSLRLIADGDPRLLRMRTDLGMAGNHGPLVAAALRKYLMFTHKAEYAYDHGMPQWVAHIDHLFSWLHLERLFLGRHKYYHFRVWYRDVLGDYVREVLLDSRSLARPYLDRKGVEAVVHGHLQGGRNYTFEIHKLLTLELLHRLFVDASR